MPSTRLQGNPGANRTQPRGKSLIFLDNSHTHATRIGWHLWEIDLRVAPGLPPGWSSCATGRLGLQRCKMPRLEALQVWSTRRSPPRVVIQAHSLLPPGPQQQPSPALSQAGLEQHGHISAGRQGRRRELSLKFKASIWPGLSCMCRVRSTAVLRLHSLLRPVSRSVSHWHGMPSLSLLPLHMGLGIARDLALLRRVGPDRVQERAGEPSKHRPLPPRKTGFSKVISPTNQST